MKQLVRGGMTLALSLLMLTAPAWGMARYSYRSRGHGGYRGSPPLRAMEVKTPFIDVKAIVIGPWLRFLIFKDVPAVSDDTHFDNRTKTTKVKGAAR